MKLKKSVKKNFKIVIIIFIVLVMLVIGYFAYKRFFTGNNTGKEPVVVDKIDSYGYTLAKDEPKKYKELYEKLRKVLKADKINEEEYAKLVSELLVFDFYNLNDKLSKNDVGGVQFIKEEYRNNFVLEAEETVYKYIEHNIYGDRTQKLPVVTDVVSETVTATTYKYKDISDEEAYKVVVKVTYKEDLGYPTSVTVVLIHGNSNSDDTDKDNIKKLEVIKMY